MLDRSNINRVKGILSAKKGAEIPKFQQPGGPLPKPFSIQNGKYYLDNKEVTKEMFFQDPRVQKAYENHVNQFLTNPSAETTSTVPPVATTIPTAGSLNGTGVQTQVVGGTPTDPNASVVKASEVVAQVANELDRQKAQQQAQAVAEATKGQQKVVDTAGMNFNGNKDDDEDGNGKTGWKNLKEQALQTSMAAFNGIGQAVGAQQAVTDSNTTKAVDTAYDTVSGIAENFGPVGKFVGAAMKNAAMAGDIIQSLGGGTDQQTATDKWMDSSFFSWNIGMINGFFGKEADKFSADQDILASVGSSYGGTAVDINDAAAKSGKKYGLFSSGARRKANQEMANARSKQNTMGDISDTAAIQRFSVQSMGEQAGLAYSMLTDGGYNQKYTYAAKQGGIIEWNPVIELEQQPQVELNWDLHILKEGGAIDLTEELEWIPEVQTNKSDFNTWFNSIPKRYRAAGYDYKKAYEVFDWDLLENHAKDPDKYHLYSVSPTPDENGNYPFLKLGKLNENPELKGEFDWYNSEAGKDHKAKFDIQYIGDRYYYVPKKFKNGGKTEESNTPEIEETTQKNVIPEGALHKNKHHMDHAEGLTKKGIPVIDEDGEQQAEIELNEIIFTLEVTKQLEEYYNIFYSEESTNKEKEQAALDAGKLLVYQILENTEDRTGLIESCKKGGTLQLKKSTDDLIEEVLDWMPTLVVVEEVVEEIKEKEEEKPKKKSEKEQMKEAIKEVLIELLIK